MGSANKEYGEAMRAGAPEGYGITAYNGPETNGQKYYFTPPTYRWNPSEIGKPPKHTLYDEREEAVAAAVKHDEGEE